MSPSTVVKLVILFLMMSSNWMKNDLSKEWKIAFTDSCGHSSLMKILLRILISLVMYQTDLITTTR